MNKPNEEKVTGHRVRLHNRRVEVFTSDQKPDSVAIVWKKLDGKEVKKTSVTLSREGAEATVILLMDALESKPSAGVLHIQGQPTS